MYQSQRGNNLFNVKYSPNNTYTFSPNLPTQNYQNQMLYQPTQVMQSQPNLKPTHQKYTSLDLNSKPNMKQQQNYLLPTAIQQSQKQQNNSIIIQPTNYSNQPQDKVSQAFQLIQQQKQQQQQQQYQQQQQQQTYISQAQRSFDYQNFQQQQFQSFDSSANDFYKSNKLQKIPEKNVVIDLTNQKNEKSVKQKQSPNIQEISDNPSQKQQQQIKLTHSKYFSLDLNSGSNPAILNNNSYKSTQNNQAQITQQQFSQQQQQQVKNYAIAKPQTYSMPVNFDVKNNSVNSNNETTSTKQQHPNTLHQKYNSVDMNKMQNANNYQAIMQNQYQNYIQNQIQQLSNQSTAKEINDKFSTLKVNSYLNVQPSQQQDPKKPNYNNPNDFIQNTTLDKNNLNGYQQSPQYQQLQQNNNFQNNYNNFMNGYVVTNKNNLNNNSISIQTEPSQKSTDEECKYCQMKNYYSSKFHYQQTQKCQLCQIKQQLQIIKNDKHVATSSEKKAVSMDNSSQKYSDYKSSSFNTYYDQINSSKSANEALKNDPSSQNHFNLMKTFQERLYGLNTKEEQKNKSNKNTDVDQEKLVKQQAENIVILKQEPIQIDQEIDNSQQIFQNEQPPQINNVKKNSQEFEFIEPQKNNIDSNSIETQQQLMFGQQQNQYDQEDNVKMSSQKQQQEEIQQQSQQITKNSPNVQILNIQNINKEASNMLKDLQQMIQQNKQLQQQFQCKVDSLQNFKQNAKNTTSPSPNKIIDNNNYYSSNNNDGRQKDNIINLQNKIKEEEDPQQINFSQQLSNYNNNFSSSNEKSQTNILKLETLQKNEDFQEEDQEEDYNEEQLENDENKMIKQYDEQENFTEKLQLFNHKNEDCLENKQDSQRVKAIINLHQQQDLDDQQEDDDKYENRETFQLDDNQQQLKIPLASYDEIMESQITMNQQLKKSKSAIIIPLKKDRKDRYGTPIIKGSKKHKISFKLKDELAEVKLVDCWKQETKRDSIPVYEIEKNRLEFEMRQTFSPVRLKRNTTTPYQSNQIIYSDHFNNLSQQYQPQPKAYNQLDLIPNNSRNQPLYTNNTNNTYNTNNNKYIPQHFIYNDQTYLGYNNNNNNNAFIKNQQLSGDI